RADQGDDPVFDPGQERILLRLVEPMDLVAKEDRAAPFVAQPALRLGDDLADTGHSLRHGRERLEVAIGVVRDEAGERRLARPGRAPEDAGPDLAAANQLAEGLSGAQQVLLAQELLQCARPHAGGERLGGTVEEGRVRHGMPNRETGEGKPRALRARGAFSGGTGRRRADGEVHLEREASAPAGTGLDLQFRPYHSTSFRHIASPRSRRRRSSRRGVTSGTRIRTTLARATANMPTPTPA